MDAAIARTVWQLLAWGYPLRRRVAPLVAQLAAEVLGRTDHHQRPLSAVRIEQIMEEWLPDAGFGWIEPSTKRRSPGRPWVGTSQDSLEAARPRGLTLEATARRLLQEGGKPPWPRHAPLGDGHLTAKRDADWRRVRNAVFPREDDENGVEK